MTHNVAKDEKNCFYLDFCRHFSKSGHGRLQKYLAQFLAVQKS